MAGYIAGTGTEIKGCWNSGTVEGTAGNYIGGMVGAIAADTVIDGCYNLAGSAVTGTSGASTGGILGGAVTGTPVSYTHLDVYKRQVTECAK